MGPCVRTQRAASESSEVPSFRGRLADRREAMLAGLLSSLPDREPRRYLYDPLAQYLSRMGKAIRPALCLSTCAAFGGDERAAMDSALAIEMLHNAFLVHDDIEDGSELRHGQATFHTEHGVPLAVNAGDMLNALALRLVRQGVPRLGNELTWYVLNEFDHMMQQSLEGQAMELGWVRDNRLDLTERDYLRLVLKKTCWYSFIHPCRIGALIATHGDVDLDRFNRFGYYLGAAFQIQDDLLNLMGAERRYGKEIGGDLYEGKRTLMLIHVREHVDRHELRRVDAFLERERRARVAADVEWILNLMRARGSLAHGVSVARQLAGAAKYEFTRSFGDCPRSEHTVFVEQLIDYVVHREL